MNHPCVRLVFSNKNSQNAISPPSTHQYNCGVAVPHQQQQISAIRLLQTIKHPATVSLPTTILLKPSGTTCNSSNEITEQGINKATTTTPVLENPANSPSSKDTCLAIYKTTEASSAIAACKNIFLTNFLLIF